MNKRSHRGTLRKVLVARDGLAVKLEDSEKLTITKSYPSHNRGPEQTVVLYLEGLNRLKEVWPELEEVMDGKTDSLLLQQQYHLISSAFYCEQGITELVSVSVICVEDVVVSKKSAKQAKRHKTAAQCEMLLRFASCRIQAVQPYYAPESNVGFSQHPEQVIMFNKIGFKLLGKFIWKNTTTTILSTEVEQLSAVEPGVELEDSSIKSPVELEDLESLLHQYEARRTANQKAAITRPIHAAGEVSAISSSTKEDDINIHDSGSASLPPLSMPLLF